MAPSVGNLLDSETTDEMKSSKIALLNICSAVHSPLLQWNFAERLTKLFFKCLYEFSYHFVEHFPVAASEAYECHKKLQGCVHEVCCSGSDSLHSILIAF